MYTVITTTTTTDAKKDTHTHKHKHTYIHIHKMKANNNGNHFRHNKRKVQIINSNGRHHPPDNNNNNNNDDDDDDNNNHNNNNKRRRNRDSDELSLRTTNKESKMFTCDTEYDYPIVLDGNIPLNDYLKQKYKNFSCTNPEIEILRRNYMKVLREKHIELIKDMVQIDAPKESFNRWLVERKLMEQFEGKNSGQVFDPLLPSICCDENGNFISNKSSVCLLNEVLDDIPLKVNMFPSNTLEAKRSFTQYLNACIKLANNDEIYTPLSKEEKEQINQICQDEFQWLRTITEPQKEKQIIDKLKQLKVSVGSILQKRMRPKVEELCIQLSLFAHEKTKSLRDAIKAIDEKDVEKVRVTKNNQTSKVVFNYKKYSFSLNHEHYEKLKNFYLIRQFILHETKIFNEPQFHQHLFCLLCRYDSYFGWSHPFEGSGLQGAVPEATFDRLREDFGVCMECFASPLNSYFPNYCSAFSDIDHLFGSVSSFFDFHPISGSFEVNPPFTEELMIQMVIHIENLLRNSKTEPLSFIIFVPNWTDAKSLQSMESSSFLRYDFVLKARSYGFINGLQHSTKSSKRYFKSVHDSHVYFLQNDAGYKKWKPNDEKIRLLTASMQV
jgi:phosphorylated CTD-interacting factor 1